MIFEFAIEPELVATWGDLNNYRFFADKFGIGQPRIMTEYPKLKKWRRKVLMATPKDDMVLQRVTALIQILSETMVARNVTSYDGNIEWLENAEKEDNRFPFYAILALANPRNHPNVLNADSLGTTNNSKWHIDEQLPDVPRKASDIVKTIKPLLLNCHRAVFIDPFFMAGADILKWKRPFEMFMRELSASRCQASEIQIEVHSSADIHKAPTEKYFEKRCREELTDVIPHGLQLRFKRWRQKPGGKKLHDRYFLTDIGGVDFSIGLDEGNEGEVQKISLLKKNTYDSVWEDYMGKHPAFDSLPGFTIPEIEVFRKPNNRDEAS